MTNVGYVVSVREVERGWGDRPDGFLICKENSFDDYVSKSKAFNKDQKEFSELNSTPKLVKISDKAVLMLENSDSGVIWIHHGELKEYVFLD